MYIYMYIYFFRGPSASSAHVSTRSTIQRFHQYTRDPSIVPAARYKIEPVKPLGTLGKVRCSCARSSAGRRF